jgi:hypothetical protein
MSRYLPDDAEVEDKKRMVLSSILLEIERSESLFQDLPELQTYLWIQCTDRADITLREIFEPGSGFYAPVGLATFLIIDIIAHGADIPGRMPFIEPPFANPPFPVLPADRADITLGKVIE